MKQALIIFVRKPEYGKVKTRLAETVGKDKALEIYRELLEHTKEIAAGVGADKFVYYSDAIDKEDLWANHIFFKRVQANDELGARMSQAFEEVFANGYKKAIVIGSDCFELTKEMIEHGFSVLNKKDIVIGPAADGGYYLLGMKTLERTIFQDKAWSSDSVYQQTVTDFKNLSLTFEALPVLRDVDTEADWKASKKTNV
jgi:hypothetical protein